MQDLLVYVTKGISAITTALRQEGKQVSAKINHLITLNLFTTITNANFDKESIESRIRATLTEKEVLLKQVTNLTVLPEAAKWNGSENWEEKARTVGVLSTENEDIRSLREGRGKGRFPAAAGRHHRGFRLPRPHRRGDCRRSGGFGQDPGRHDGP